MSEKIDREAILETFKEKLFAPTPSFWKANITLGKTTELEYYSKIIVGQTFCIRQKDRLKRRLFREFINRMKSIIYAPDDYAEYPTCDYDDFKAIIRDYEEKLK